MNQSKFQSGFSLYELIAVLTIIGIALAMSLPQMYRQVMRRNNEATYLQFKAILKHAQAEAFRRGAPITVCAASFFTNSSGNHTYLGNNTCNGQNWNEGVLVLRDLNQNGSYNTGERIRAYRFDADVSITATTSVNAGVSSFIIASNGQIATANTPFSFTFSQSKYGMSYTRKICVNSYGNVCIKNEDDTSACTSTGDTTCN